MRRGCRAAVDGIMGTRIFVELWAEDDAKQRGEQAIDAVMDEMRHIDESMSVYKPTSEVSKVNSLAVQQPVTISPGALQAVDHGARVFAHYRRRFRHYLRQRGLYV